MAKKVTKNTKQASATSTRKSPQVRVKHAHEVVESITRILSHNLHHRYNFRLSKNTQKKLVAYGPWLATFLIIVVIPELLIFAKTGSLVGLTSFFDTILFNQASWVVLVILFINILLLVDGISHLFEKERRGWLRIYQASLLAASYIVWQFFNQITHPAAPLVSLVGMLCILFSLLDIEEYYR